MNTIKRAPIKKKAPLVEKKESDTPSQNNKKTPLVEKKESDTPSQNNKKESNIIFQDMVKAEVVKRPVSKIYKLLKYQPISFTLNVGRNKKLLVWDEDTQTSRAIRHCPNERVIWLDEQNKEIAVVEPIVFINGILNTSSKEVYTQEFLDKHPKRGFIFDEINAEADASLVIGHEDVVLDVKQAIRDRVKDEGGIEALRAVVAVLTSDPGGAAIMTPSELRFAAYQAVDTNVQRFVDDRGNVTIFDDADIKRTAIAQHAFLSGVLQVSPNGRQIIWYDTKSAICNIPVGLNYLQVFSEFLATDEGMLVAVELTKR